MLVLLLIIGLAVLLILGYVISEYAGQQEMPLYADEGLQSPVFVDEARGIRAKPDRLEGTRDSATLIEYKHRASRVYESDIAQVIASVLAVRASGIRVDRAWIELKDGRTQPVALSKNNDALERRIHQPLADARQVAAGLEPRALPVHYKCSSCSFRRSCKHSRA